jgi:uncharacterized membrane protein YidH (DUF202 family)
VTGEKSSVRAQNRRVHMANERTFLAWIRTSIGIMAFGFVVEKFSLFIRQLQLFLGGRSTGEIPLPPIQANKSPSSLLGIFLVGLGAAMGFLAFIRYKRTERQIDQDTYQPSILLDILLTTAMVAIGFFLVIYLSHNM